MLCSWVWKHISCRWKALSSQIKEESLLNGPTKSVTPPSLVSALWFSSPSVIRSGKKTTSGDWQPTTGFMAVVSGGRRVSRSNEHRRDFTLPSCALTHTALPPSPLTLTHFCPGGTNSQQGDRIVCKCLGMSWVLFCFFLLLLLSCNSFLNSSAKACSHNYVLS